MRKFEKVSMNNERKIKIYLIARISKDAHHWNETVCAPLKSDMEVFLPHEHNPWNLEHNKIQYNVFETDLQAMKNSDIGLALPEFGSDCSFEVGWYANSTKPVIFFITNQVRWLRNWMVKGGVDVVVTTQRDIYHVLLEDPILKFKKVIYIEAVNHLSGVIQEVYHERYLEKL